MEKEIIIYGSTETTCSSRDSEQTVILEMLKAITGKRE